MARRTAFEGAYRKGFEAGAASLPKRNPYGDYRTWYGGITFSRAFQQHWERGYMHGAAEAYRKLSDGNSEQEAWARNFTCPNCGPCSYNMVRPDKTCALCEANLIRG